MKIFILFSLILTLGVGIITGAIWHRAKIPPFGMGLVDGQTPGALTTEEIQNIKDERLLIRRRGNFDLYPKRQANIVMLGDSITAGINWNEIMDRRDIAGRAVGNDTTLGMLDRLDQVYNLNPKVVFIMAGINDIKIGRDVDEIIKTYSKIIHAIKSKSIVPIIQSTLFRNNSDENKIIKQLNNKLLSMAKLENIVFLDLNETFRRGNFINPSFTNDGGHPNVRGFTVWAKFLNKFLKNSNILF